MRRSLPVSILTPERSVLLGVHALQTIFASRTLVISGSLRLKRILLCLAHRLETLFRSTCNRQSADRILTPALACEDFRTTVSALGMPHFCKLNTALQLRDPSEGLSSMTRET